MDWHDLIRQSGGSFERQRSYWDYGSMIKTWPQNLADILKQQRRNRGRRSSERYRGRAWAAVVKEYRRANTGACPLKPNRVPMKASPPARALPGDSLRVFPRRPMEMSGKK
jgi:hypothetical protein